MVKIVVELGFLSFSKFQTLLFCLCNPSSPCSCYIPDIILSVLYFSLTRALWKMLFIAILKVCISQVPLTKYLVKITSSLFPFLLCISRACFPANCDSVLYVSYHLVPYFTEKRDGNIGAGDLSPIFLFFSFFSFFIQCKEC